MPVIIRDFAPADLGAVKKIHEDSGIDYQLPDLTSPLFCVTKTVLVDGVVRAFAGARVQAELYLMLDRTDWASPREKLEIVTEMERIGMTELGLKGIDCACLWLPPGMERFGKRLEKLGFSRDRDGWLVYSKAI